MTSVRKYTFTNGFSSSDKCDIYVAFIVCAYEVTNSMKSLMTHPFC